MTEHDPSPGSGGADGGVPTLVDPVLVAAFEGWNDAGEAASTALEHLELSWDAQPLTSIDPEEYYDFQVTRPHVKLAGGVTRKIEWQTTRLSWANLPGPTGTSCSSTASSRTCAGARSAASSSATSSVSA